MLPIPSAKVGLFLIKKELYSKGAIYAAMSGSGSSVFGLFSPEEKITKMDFEAAFCFQTELK